MSAIFAHLNNFEETKMREGDKLFDTGKVCLSFSYYMLLHFLKIL